MKGKGEVSETMLNEKEASQLSDMEFKELVIRKLNELTENYQKLQWTHCKLYEKMIKYIFSKKKQVKTIMQYHSLPSTLANIFIFNV